MDNMNYLPVRFQLGGEFVHHGETIDFMGGDEAWSYIERKKVSVCEIVANLKRHMIITDKDLAFLHWLFPGKELVNSLRPLYDDKECSYMLECTTGGAIANVYAEVVHENSEEEDDSDLENQVEEKEESGSEGDDHVISIPIAISSPSKDLERYISFKDWEGDDLENLEEDEEAKQYRRHVKMVKKGIKGREDIYEALVQARHQVPQLYVDEDLDVGNDTPYFDSSEEASYDDDEGPEISGCRRKSRFPRFDDATPLPIFQLP
ncbi:uncharacterized protein LOC111257893 [Setaria italica]|uniref:uncharacterized protein LOC111257893 n=1 Tax=Setaria italica TaxID=4555 RepID=UPI000BE56567|nr:uncharacterized protein LOC111257893 [Setaria italica]